MEKYQFAEELKAFMEHSEIPFGIFQTEGLHVETLILSDGFCRLFGYENHAQAYEGMNNNIYQGIHPDDQARTSEAIRRFITEGGNLEIIYRSRKRKGEGYHIIHSMGKHLETGAGLRLTQVWYTDEGTYIEDSMEHAPEHGELNLALNNALHEESLIRANYYDYLTGLPSMNHFFELAEAGREKILAKEKTPVLLYMNLCGMKYFNQKHSFSDGDKLLKSFAKVLSDTFGIKRCCHIGSDHFAVFTEDDNLEEILYNMFKECQNMNEGTNLPVRVGIYKDPQEHTPVSTACDRAKFACDSLGVIYQSAFNYFDKELRDAVEKKRYIVQNLDRAIQEKWIQVYYQPIVRAVNEKVSDDEALSRWIDPVFGFLSPADFIPVLEEAGTIYKLDLYVVEQVLEKIKIEMDLGLHVVSQSVNLSRSDFDACDIVEEIRSRVDDAGVSRDKITIEITESVIGSDFEFMKNQINRFRELGFPVWMDDFGSGYSSLDLLQSIRCDLIKFDMSFMKQMEENGNSRIILSELMKMATALGIDTVCEGVETREQIRFLREIGCSKLQGYYYSKPIPLNQLLQRYETGQQIGYENPAETEYYEAMGRVNLYDLAVLASEDESDLQNFFNALPMGIIEIKGDTTRFVRSNQPYRDFIRRFFHYDLSHEGSEFVKYDAQFLKNIVQTCCVNGVRTFYDEKMPNGSVVHSFARRIGVNPVNGNIAIAIAVLSIREADEAELLEKLKQEQVVFGRIMALSDEYLSLFTIDPESGQYIEYSVKEVFEELGFAKSGDDFFKQGLIDGMQVIHPEDLPNFLSAFHKENILQEIADRGIFKIKYRLLLKEGAKPVCLKIGRVREEDGDKLIAGVMVTD